MKKVLIGQTIRALLGISLCFFLYLGSNESSVVRAQDISSGSQRFDLDSVRHNIGRESSKERQLDSERYIRENRDDRRVRLASQENRGTVRSTSEREIGNRRVVRENSQDRSSLARESLERKQRVVGERLGRDVNRRIARESRGEEDSRRFVRESATRRSISESRGRENNRIARGTQRDDRRLVRENKDNTRRSFQENRNNRQSRSLTRENSGRQESRRLTRENFGREESRRLTREIFGREEGRRFVRENRNSAENRNAVRETRERLTRESQREVESRRSLNERDFSRLTQKTRDSRIGTNYRQESNQRISRENQNREDIGSRQLFREIRTKVPESFINVREIREEGVIRAFGKERILDNRVGIVAAERRVISSNIGTKSQEKESTWNYSQLPGLLLGGSLLYYLYSSNNSKVKVD